MMLLHSVIIAFVIYLVMIFVFRRDQMVAENTSLLLGAVILVYMILFGHGLPTNINKKLFV